MADGVPWPDSRPLLRCGRLGDLQEAGAHFESALTITSTQPEQQAALNQTKIEIGLAQGNLEFSQWMATQSVPL